MKTLHFQLKGNMVRFRVLIVLLVLVSLVAGQVPIGDADVKCAICALAVNEVEGFIMENQTNAQISASLAVSDSFAWVTDLP